MSGISLSRQFTDQFPNEEACLHFLFKKTYENKPCPQCSCNKFYAVKNRKSYACGKCGHQIYPMQGTLMENSKASLMTWFDTIYDMLRNKTGTCALDIAREMQISYPTALKITHVIREAMKDDSVEFSGTIEVDETWVGGKRGSRKGKNKVGFNGQDNKTIVMGIVERGGRVITQVVDGRSGKVLLPIIKKYVRKDSIINSDEHQGYRKLADYGYKHGVIPHKKYRWTIGPISTNTIEGYWSRLKRSILGRNHHVSKKHLQKYLYEIAFKYNRRKKSRNEMFEEVIQRLINPPRMNKTSSLSTSHKNSPSIG